jgi:acetyltransferase
MPPPRRGRFDPDRLFRPRSLVVVGARTPLGERVLASVGAGGFAGPVHLDDDPDAGAAPDLALVCDGSDLAATFRALAGRGCYAACVLAPAQGVAEAARAAGMRAIGPGSFGIAVPAIGLNATSAHLAPKPGRVALVSQSRGMCRAVLDWAAPNGVGFSLVVGLGGAADAGFSLVLDWLARDPGTGAILLDVRDILDRRAFLSAARAASRLRPVVALRAGGQLGDPSGRAEGVFEAALRRAGVVRVTRFADLLGAAETLARARPARSEALAIVSNAVGPGLLAADAALHLGLSVARLTPETRVALETFLGRPDGCERAGEALAYTGADRPTRVAEAAAMLSGAPEVGGVVAVLAPTGEGDAAAAEALAAAAKAMRVPLLAAVLGQTTAAAHRQRLAALGVPEFDSPEQAVRAFLLLVAQRRAQAAARELPGRAVLELAPERATVARVFARVRRAGRSGLLQDEALAVLAAYGLPTVPSRPVMTPGDAATTAALLGFPAVLKLRRSTRPHAAGPGAVALDLGDEAAIRRAAARLDRLRDREGIAEGYLVQRQAGRARELRISAVADPQFGPAIAFGLGGSVGELLGDLAWDLPPLNLALADALVERAGATRLLAAQHSEAAADRAAVAGALVRVSQLLVDFPEIEAAEINPLFADSYGVVAADAWIGLRPPGEFGHLAIAPYPADLAEQWGPAGKRLLIRPIRPEDAEAHAALFNRLTPEDVRYRFFSALRSLSPEQVARMTQVDYGREMAFVAVQEGAAGLPSETVGAARLVREAHGDLGEFAILVEGAVRGRGIGRRLMEKLIAWGREQGMTEIVGQVLADNAPMRAFMQRLGFALRRLPEETDVLEARLKL